jgi:hypothetical protein
VSENPQPQGEGNQPRPEAAMPGEAEAIPVAKPAASGEFGPRPIFDLAEDRCPKCGSELPTTAVVCVKCGYDQRANVVREVETGTVEVAPPAPETKSSENDFVQAGKLTPKTLAIVGGVLTAGAMVSTGVFGPNHTFWLVVGNVLLTLYLIVVNTATGVGAVAVAARMNSQPLGRLDYAAASMFAAFAMFQAAINTRPSLGYQVLTGGVPFVVGAGLYFGAVMLLFKKDRRTAMMIAAAHFILWILLQLGPVLAGWVAAATVMGPAGG